MPGLLACDLGQPEIEDLGMSAIGDKNVCRLDVAVHDAFAVRGIQGIGHFNAQAQEHLEFHRLALDQVFQGLAAEALHHDEQRPSCCPIS